jgi:hypothetical protein
MRIVKQLKGNLLVAVLRQKFVNFFYLGAKKAKYIKFNIVFNEDYKMGSAISEQFVSKKLL